MEENEEFEITFEQILNVVQKGFLPCAIIVMVTTTLAFLGTKLLLDDQYIATAKLVVTQDIDGNNEITYSELLKTNEISKSVLANIATNGYISNDESHSQYIDTQEYINMVSVNLMKETKVIEISVESDSPMLSAIMANEIVSVFTNKVNNIMKIENVEVLEEAKVPVKKSSPSLKSNMIKGAMLGFVIDTMILAFILFIDRKVKSEEEVKTIFKKPVIGLIADMDDLDSKKFNHQNNTSIVTLTNRSASIAEAYRSLRANIIMRDFDHKIKVINVTSNSINEEKTTTIINLGVVYAQLNKKVLIIDMNLRNPKIHERLDINNKIGLSDVVNEQANLEDAIIKYDSCLDVITAGSEISFVSDFVQSQALSKFIDSLKENYELILVDCPSIEIASDALIISNFCDGTILAVSYDRNEKKDLIRIKETIDEANINLLGTVITKMPNSIGNHNLTFKSNEKSKETKKKSIFDFK